MKPITSQLIHTVVVYRPTRTADGQGGYRETLAVLNTTLGRLRPLGGAERISAAQQQAQVSHVLYTEGDEDIERGDVVLIDGRRLAVLDVREPSYMAHHLEIDCRLIVREPV